MADYTVMTLAELEAEFIRLGHLLAAMQDSRHALFQLISKRKAEARAANKVALLSPVDKDALRTVLNEDVTRTR